MTTKKPTTEWKPPKKKPTTEWKPPKKKLITEYNLPPRKPPIRKHDTLLSELPPEGFTKFERVRRKPITSEEAYEELLHGKKSLLPLGKKKEPSTIVNIKQPIAGRRKGEPVPPPPHTPLKPAPGRSPTLKWKVKKR